MPSFIADILFPVNQKPIREGLLKTENDGTIVDCIAPESAHYDTRNATRLSGWLVPGFVNCHVHLELSHLKNLLPQKRGLNNFLEDLTRIPAPSDDVRKKAMLHAIDEMYASGTVAALDISNNESSFDLKINAGIDFFTAVEVFGFDPEKAEQKLKEADYLLNILPNDTGVIAPHAPYSVSKPLWKGIRERINASAFPLLTIHSQESLSEQDFFMNGKGEIAARFSRMGIPYEHFIPPKTSSIEYITAFIEKNWRILLVHNTYAQASELQELLKKVKDLYLCLCPSANLYIEAKLPDLPSFINTNIPITIGTDSIASNESLKILKELVILQTHFHGIESEQLIQFATLNGAKLLNKQDKLGSFEIGKKPGLVLIENVQNETIRLTPEASAKRIL